MVKPVLVTDTTYSDETFNFDLMSYFGIGNSDIEDYKKLFKTDDIIGYYKCNRSEHPICKTDRLYIICNNYRAFPIPHVDNEIELFDEMTKFAKDNFCKYNPKPSRTFFKDKRIIDIKSEFKDYLKPIEFNEDIFLKHTLEYFSRYKYIDINHIKYKYARSEYNSFDDNLYINNSYPSYFRVHMMVNYRYIMLNLLDGKYYINLTDEYKNDKYFIYEIDMNISEFIIDREPLSLLTNEEINNIRKMANSFIKTNSAN